MLEVKLKSKNDGLLHSNACLLSSFFFFLTSTGFLIQSPSLLMAYAALVSLTQTINLITNYHQDSITPQLNDQITSLQKHAIFLQESLENFPHQTTSVEARIKNSTQFAEDVIESLLSDALLKSRSKFKRQLRGKWEQIQSHYTSLKLKSKFRSSKSKKPDLFELKKATKEIELVGAQMMAMKLEDKLHSCGSTTGSTSSPTLAPIHQDEMVGFRGELMEMKLQLCGEPSSKLQVIPVVGMGGIGKTTLAINTYHDPLIMERFTVRAWITVSQDYSIKQIVSTLLASMEVPDSQSDAMKQLHVFQNLKHRRYLIVLDDIWSVKVWDELQIMFPNDNNGSRIILTTRLLDVATYVNSSNHIHQMQLMNEDQSWDLLRHKVFKQDPYPNKLAFVGKMIARSCRGLPLAIVVISGILAADQTKSNWNNIARNVNSVISENDEQYEKILSLSYDHLPHHLKSCFLYMAGFPEYYEMRASKLIRLWVAEGFLKPEALSLEQMAEKYLEDLVQRSLVLVTQRKSSGKIKSFIIHDLLREMCIRKPREENFLLQLRGLIHEPPRRISILYSNLDFLQSCNGTVIRTIICLEERRQRAQCSMGFFRLLRVLDLINAYEYFYNCDTTNSSKSLPEELLELFHLRYLAFDYTFTIPEAIINLRNLQTLIIGPRRYRGYFAQMAVEIWRMPQQLPAEIWKMPQLRHLVFCSGLRLFQRGAIVAMDNLQTLSLAVNFSCNPEILRMIPNLKKLGLYYTRREYLHTHAINEEQSQIYSLMHLDQLQNLSCLKLLENLKMKIHHSLPYPGKTTLRGLPRSLKKLSLSGLKLPWKHMKVVGSLPNLEVLKLRDFACNGVEWETNEGEFCELRYLVICQSNLRHWITESSHFPRLKRVVLLRCPNLQRIPDSVGEIPTLEIIEIDSLNRSLVESAKQILHEQESCGNDGLQLRFV